MTELLPAWPLLSAFIIASTILAITPGPGVFYIVTRSILQGRRHGLASVAGVALGNLGNAIGAAIGLAALFAVSAVAFSVVKYAGALYLVYLGIRALAKPPQESGATPAAPASISKIFRDGFVIALLNPKTTIFFAAFLPQFMRPDAPWYQSSVLGALFVAIAALTDSLYAVAAGSVGPRLSRHSALRPIGRYLGATAFIGLGVFTALSGRK